MLIGYPPVPAGAVHETSTRVSPFVAVTDVGAPGVVHGVSAKDFSDHSDVPAAFVALTLNL